VTLEVAGRRSGRAVRFPLWMADSDGEWYLVAMLGEQCNWVQNVRAAGARAGGRLFGTGGPRPASSSKCRRASAHPRRPARAHGGL
jgi:F420H(2)-dependent quinone reductase